MKAIHASARLIELKTEGSPLSSNDLTYHLKYSILAGDDARTVDQTLSLTSTHEGWVAEMPMDEFPPQASAGDAALKLACWFELMAKGLREGDYGTICINDLIKS